MPDRLHLMLLALTLLDLAFVGVTGVVPGFALAPLVALACVAPWLRRLQRFRSYRAAWNICVLVIFMVLVHHASTTGLLHMLEDGLLLAVLCQVHLLNNVGERQRPDLVFFNSFLIAFVTSFFATHIAWSVLFVVHAAVFVPALEVNVLARRADTVRAPVHRLLLRDCIPRIALIGLCTALVFVFCPRDFHHEGWLGHALARHVGLEAGMADVIRLDDEGPVRLGNQIVMRITTRAGESADIPSHWRGMSYAMFDGSSWQPRDDVEADGAWERTPGTGWSRPTPPVAGELLVQSFDTSARRLLLPLEACHLQPIRTTGILLQPVRAGGFVCMRAVDDDPTPLEYAVRSGATSGRMPVSAHARNVFLQLPRRSVVRTAGQLAEPLRHQLPPDAKDHEIARHLADWLRANRRYQLPGGQGFAGSIEAFAIGSGAGHCEDFATLLALMLRSQDIPCRLVGGYLAQERSEDGAVLVRSKHAHAWVEVLLRNEIWSTLDATPPTDDGHADGARDGWWQAISGGLDDLWNSIVGFDDRGRAGLLTMLGDLPRASGRAIAAHPFTTVVLMALPIAFIWLRRRNRGRPLEIVSLLAAARSAGVNLQTGETPRELLTRAQTTAAADTAIAALAAAVHRHERARYGCNVDAN